jgi:glycosyltransferase involved in cell wall biosynthesis
VRGNNIQILQFVDSFNIGGAEVVAMSIAEGLQSRGYDCVLCAIGKDGNIREHLQKKGIKGYCLGKPYGFSLKLIGAIAKIIWHEHADIVVTHHFRQLIHAFLPAKILGKKLVHIEHDYHFYEDKPVILKRLRFLLKFADSFVCVAPEIVDWFKEKVPGIAHKSVFINNGVDTDRFRPDIIMRESMRNKYGIAPETFVVGTCARLEPIKNIELLIDGFAGFQKHHVDAKLIIIGDGSQRKLLRQRAKQHGIDGVAIFAGMQHEVEKYLSMFDVYAITSRDEGLPLSVLEAMAVGLPVIATNVGALPQLLTDKLGVLLGSHTPEALMKALLVFSTNPELLAELGGGCRSFVNESYSLKHMVDHYEEVFGDGTMKDK